ncbi:hypothetical protein LX36DRAFT_260105 [Colletotrichum falcatum]|nr:hypothetical protein LX36DRAFT_260105 [Colletotrichum falcatum]
MPSSFVLTEGQVFGMQVLKLALNHATHTLRRGRAVRSRPRPQPHSRNDFPSSTQCGTRGSSPPGGWHIDMTEGDNKRELWRTLMRVARSAQRCFSCNEKKKSEQQGGRGVLNGFACKRECEGGSGPRRHASHSPLAAEKLSTSQRTSAFVG